MNGVSYIAVDDGALTVTPSCPQLEEFLILHERRMEKQGFTMKPVTVKTPMFKVTEDGFSGKPRTIMTYQGFDVEIKEFLESLGHYVITKYLQKVPAVADISKIKGLRFGQSPLLITALVQQRSGLIGAPTRYGKSYLIINTIRCFPNSKIVVTAPGVDLVRQLYDDIRSFIKLREVKLICSGSRVRVPSQEITVCSMDSLHKCDTAGTDVLLIDEPHAAVSESRIPAIQNFYRAIKIGFGATLEGRYDKRDRLITGLIGPVLANRSYLEAVAEGAVSRLKVVFIRVPYDSGKVSCKSRDAALRNLVLKNPTLLTILDELINDIIPQEWQTLLFIREEKQADYYAGCMDPDTTIAMAKKMNKKEREEVTARLKDDTIKRALCSNIYVQGVTFSNIKCLVNLASGGANTSAIQKPGRLLEVVDGKNYGVMFDFMFYDVNDAKQSNAMVGESNARHKVYKNIGYEIEFVDGLNDIKPIIDGAYDI